MALTNQEQQIKNEMNSVFKGFIFVVAIGLTWQIATQKTEARLDQEWRERLNKTVESVKENHVRFNEAELNDILWISRVIYSETKVNYEMPYIAWIVRNRLETAYRGNSYKEVALSSHQFSGLNPGDNQYDHNIEMEFADTTNNDAWRNAVRVAKVVYDSPSWMRPLPKTTRHYYSPHAIKAPDWAIGNKAVQLVRRRDAKTNSNKEIRFAFYDNIN